MVGSRTRAKIVKNKVAAPFREAEFDIIYGEGVSREGDLIDLGVAKSLLEKSGTWISYKTERLGQGRDNARQFLKENKDICAKIEHDLRKLLGLPTNLASVEDSPAKPAAAAEAAETSTESGSRCARALGADSADLGSQHHAFEQHSAALAIPGKS